MNRRLGRRAVKTDTRTLLVKHYLADHLPPAPAAVDWTKGVTQFGVMLNDTLGDCTIAGVGHAVQVWTANSTEEVIVPDTDILSYYEKWDGYNPADPASDQGGIELDVLTRWKAQGFAGNALAGFVAIGLDHIENILSSIHLFGGAYIGLNVPQYIMPQGGEPAKLWHINETANNTIIGGHCVYIVGYYHDDFGLKFKFISWGEVYEMTLDFFAKFVDEAYGLVSPDFLMASGRTPSGFALTQLLSDLELIS